MTPDRLKRDYRRQGQERRWLPDPSRETVIWNSELSIGLRGLITTARAFWEGLAGGNYQDYQEVVFTFSGFEHGVQASILIVHEGRSLAPLIRLWPEDNLPLPSNCLSLGVSPRRGGCIAFRPIRKNGGPSGNKLGPGVVEDALPVLRELLDAGGLRILIRAVDMGGESATDGLVAPPSVTLAELMWSPSAASQA